MVVADKESRNQNSPFGTDIGSDGLTGDPRYDLLTLTFPSTNSVSREWRKAVVGWWGDGNVLAKAMELLGGA